MHIVIYNRHFFPSVGGTEISGQIMARELTKFGHVVTVVTATELPANAPELNEGYQIVRTEDFLELMRLARSNDVVLSRGGVSLRAFLAALGGKVPLIIVHESDPTGGRASYDFGRWAADGVKFVLRRRAHLHVVVSDALRSLLNLPVKANWFKLYNPVSDELWTDLPKSFEKRDLHVLFVGRLVADKGLLVLRDALLALPPVESFRVAIAGDSDDRAAWESQFSEFAGEVTFLGAVSGGNLRDLYSRARILVVPSLIKEGMGMVAAEALASGTPVCASDQPALREVIGKAGLFHPIGSANHLAADIERLLSDRDYWQAMCNQTFARRGQFSMERYRERLSELVQRIERTE